MTFISQDRWKGKYELIIFNYQTGFQGTIKSSALKGANLANMKIPGLAMKFQISAKTLDLTLGCKLMVL